VSFACSPVNQKGNGENKQENNYVFFLADWRNLPFMGLAPLLNKLFYYKLFLTFPKIKECVLVFV